MENNNPEEETVNLIIGEEDSELVERLKEVINKENR